MHGSKQVGFFSQRGVSLSGLIFVLAILAAIAAFSLKIIPTFLEFRAAKAALVSAKATNGTVQEMKASFDKNADINMIKSISSKDLIVSRDSGTNELAFSYEKRIVLFPKVSLVILYDATTDPSGIVPEKTDAPPAR